MRKIDTYTEAKRFYSNRRKMERAAGKLIVAHIEAGSDYSRVLNGVANCAENLIICSGLSRARRTAALQTIRKREGC